MWSPARLLVCSTAAHWLKSSNSVNCTGILILRPTAIKCFQVHERYNLKCSLAFISVGQKIRMQTQERPHRQDGRWTLTCFTARKKFFFNKWKPFRSQFCICHWCWGSFFYSLAWHSQSLKGPHRGVGPFKFSQLLQVIDQKFCENRHLF